MNIHNSQETKKIIGANPLTVPFYENNLIIGLAHGLIIDFQCSVRAAMYLHLLGRGLTLFPLLLVLLVHDAA